MLCGKAPFHARSRDESVSSIMERIKGGDFNFDSPAWVGVSSEAKHVVQGLLTVNPNLRLRMSDLKNNPWIRGSQSFPQTPLMTPDVLLAGTSAEKSLQTTFNAFHKAQREGFRLQDVLNAKLAQRRRMKKSSSENNSSSSSSFTSESSLKSVPVTPLATRPKLSLETKKTDDECNKDVKPATAEEKDSTVFNFGENRVTEFLQTLGPNPVDPASPSNSVSARTSDVSKCESSIRESTSSSGIVVSDKNSVDSKAGRKKRERKVYVQTRQSERIRRIRLEIDDDDPVCFISLPYRTRKRKLEESTSADTPLSKIPKKEATDSPATKRGRKKVHR